MKVAGRTMLEGYLWADLKKGGQIESVLIVSHRDEAGGLEHVPYLMLTRRRGYVAIGLLRGSGVRAYRNLDRLMHFIRDDLGYRGTIMLCEEGSPDLTKLRSFAPPT